MSRASRGSIPTSAWTARASFAAEAAAVAALGYLLAQLLWVGYPPLVDGPSVFGARGAPAPAAGWLSSNANPFGAGADLGGAEIDPLAAAPETGLNLILVGVRAQSGETEGAGSGSGAGSGAGSAIIQTPDNQQRLYRVGDPIVDGTTLAAVEPGRVVILRDGARESLAFAARARVIDADPDPRSADAASAADAGAAPPAPAQAHVHGAAPVDPRALAADITPYARAAGGVVIMPRGDGAALAASGLQPLDVVLSVDGIALDGPDSLARVIAGLAHGATVQVEAERAGTPVTIELVLE